MNLTLHTQPPRTLLKRTQTRCPVCQAAIPGEVWKEGVAPGRVLLRRTCPEHGDSSACLATDARFYWLAQGKPENSGCCQPGSSCCSADGSAPASLGRNAAGHGEQPFETLSTCLALIEIVRSCNLSCPTCYADSPLGAGGKVDAVPLPELKTRIEGVIARKGKIEILQLSGGEPTLHPDFFELLAWVQGHPHIDYALINTNGVRIAHDAEFAAQLALAAQRRKLQLYLQFDGVQAAAQHFLRGADLRATRERALAVCAQIDLPVTLAMTVTPDNLPHVWEAIEFGLARPIVHGITFQPMFRSGRRPNAGPPLLPRPARHERGEGRGEGLLSDTPTNARSTTSPQPSPPSDGGEGVEALRPGTVPGAVLDAGERLNAADILLAALAQSSGRLKRDDFTPLPCGDPNCAIIGYLLRLNGQVHSVSEFLDFARLQGFLQNKIQYTVADLARCGCETEPLGALLKDLELKGSVAFRLMVKPFMDAWTWDQDRIDRCCTHVIRPDGKLDSFCRYYSGFPDSKPTLMTHGG